MPRFVFRKRHDQPGSPITALAEKAKQLGGAVLSQTGAMLYLEMDEPTYQKLKAAAEGYAISAEAKRTLPKPPRVKVKSPT